jgi:RND family efflux transporter MFP subunit
MSAPRVALLVGLGVVAGVLGTSAVVTWLDLRPAELGVARAPDPVLDPRVDDPAAGGFVGVVLPDETVDVVPRFDGRIERVLVRIGDKVVKGQVLATLSTLGVQRDLAMAEAQLAASRADSERVALELEKARAQLTRREALVAAGGTSGEEVQGARFEVRAAQTRVELASATSREREARVAQLRDRLAEAELRAPFDGTVVARFVDSGGVAQPGTVVVRVMKTAGLWVRFAIPVEQGRGVEVGSPVRIEVAHLPGSVAARVEKLAAGVDAALGVLVAEARLVAPPTWGGQAISGRPARVWRAEP